ncbi:unnamed protein product, partial [Ranitomeya imitator]
MMEKDDWHMTERLLNITLEIIYLLTGEVAVRRQDVTVYFSMEEWEYLEGHKDLYKDVMMDNPQPFISSDGSNEQSSADEDLINIKVEVRKLEEETCVKNDHLCKEEETPTYINKDGQYIGTNPWDTCLDLPQCCKIEGNIVPDSLERPVIPVMCHIHQQTSDIHYETRSKTTEVSKVRRNCKSYQCAQCSKTFTQNADLIRHSRVHTGERPFLCTDCGKCFTQKSALVYHKRIHTGERPFLCYDCGKCFAHKSILINHHRIHTGEKPFSCSDCGCLLL